MCVYRTTAASANAIQQRPITVCTRVYKDHLKIFSVIDLYTCNNPIHYSLPRDQRADNRDLGHTLLLLYIHPIYNKRDKRMHIYAQGNYCTSKYVLKIINTKHES